MKLNEGMADRSIRVVLGVTLLAMTYVGWIGVWGWIGVLPLVTGIAGYCPLYHALGWSTRSSGTSAAA